ncbi:MAG: hypothetical protein AAFR82_04025 [Pseudomonadota bacterium]
MSVTFPFEPDFHSLNKKRLADLWWAFWFPVGLIAAPLPSVALHFGIGVWWLTGLTTLVAYIFLIAGFNHLGWKERTALALDEQGLERRIWAASRKQQIVLGYSHLNEYLGFELLARPIGIDTSHFDGHEIIIRNQKDTIAVANVMKIHDDAYWQKSWYENLELDGTPILLSTLFEMPDVRKRLALAQAARSDFVCVGLTSHFVEAVSAGAAKTLSLQRAKSLGKALLSYAGLKSRRSSFHAIGLGQALKTVTDPETTEARNQRVAVILAITRRQDIRDILDLERITEALVQSYKTERVDLSNYEFSHDIANQLQNSEIDFAGYV